jgi:hypothetical protein
MGPVWREADRMRGQLQSARTSAARAQRPSNYPVRPANMLDTAISKLGNSVLAAAFKQLQLRSCPVGLPGAGKDATSDPGRERAPKNAAQNPPWMRDRKDQSTGRAKQEGAAMLAVYRRPMIGKNRLSFAGVTHDIYWDARRRLALRLRYGTASRA